MDNTLFQVFRNKYLFQYIFDQLPVKRSVRQTINLCLIQEEIDSRQLIDRYGLVLLKYRHWFRVSDILDNGYIGLLIDKLKRNEPLRFTSKDAETICSTFDSFTQFKEIYQARRLNFQSPGCINAACIKGNIDIVNHLLNNLHISDAFEQKWYLNNVMYSSLLNRSTTNRVAFLDFIVSHPVVRDYLTATNLDPPRYYLLNQDVNRIGHTESSGFSTVIQMITDASVFRWMIDHCELSQDLFENRTYRPNFYKMGDMSLLEQFNPMREWSTKMVMTDINSHQTQPTLRINLLLYYIKNNNITKLPLHHDYDALVAGYRQNVEKRMEGREPISSIVKETLVYNDLYIFVAQRINLAELAFEPYLAYEVRLGQVSSISHCIEHYSMVHRRQFYQCLFENVATLEQVKEVMRIITTTPQFGNIDDAPFLGAAARSDDFGCDIIDYLSSHHPRHHQIESSRLYRVFKNQNIMIKVASIISSDLIKGNLYTYYMHSYSFVDEAFLDWLELHQFKLFVPNHFYHQFLGRAIESRSIKMIDASIQTLNLVSKDFSLESFKKLWTIIPYILFKYPNNKIKLNHPPKVWPSPSHFIEQLFTKDEEYFSFATSVDMVECLYQRSKPQKWSIEQRAKTIIKMLEVVLDNTDIIQHCIDEQQQHTHPISIVYHMTDASCINHNLFYHISYLIYHNILHKQFIYLLYL
ncbi:hypothetical protein DFA_01801 [Cavenderia fasciculata]|uniref:Uncharacterized protein n=1 Tax=Cavenderia fasciculata TaxID=261658 RepID=F4PUV3_CACFS|nr:uncharacterized protein DFA_01801 [Cavenderia fasciculata]EGG21915.1 hypothetical protein DFA_01801 [Cavenderia fasciculata]|eukprot:XP_004359766.1 hypothetical protein DFA_01801 [Cavenderia fasciculata]